MSIIHSSLLLGAGAAAAGGYQIERSLRFNSSDSAYLSRTPASAGNRQSWTWGGWVKRSNPDTGVRQVLFSAYGASNNTGYFEFGFDNNKFYWSQWTVDAQSAAVFRDFSAWYHILVNYNGSNIVVYVNGTSVLTSAKTGDLAINGAFEHNISRQPNSGRYFDGYLAGVIFVDGQALDPTSFTEVSATTGQLVPKSYTGSFGTNGFWLKFSDNSAATATTLGKDYSGNSNNWTPNNLSVTAGAGNDSLVDTPTSYGTDTGVGGEVRGNYATLNAIAGTGTLANGNLEITSSGSAGRVSTIGLRSGKWYWETTIGSTPVYTYVGLYEDPNSILTGYAVNGTGGRISTTGGTYAVTDGTFQTGDVFGIATDIDAGTITWFRNGSTAVTLTGATLNTKTWYPGVNYNAAASTPAVFNFGQRPFAYTAPSGFKALCDTNLPAPVVAKPNTVMDVKTYTGNGSTQTISGLGFSPDLVWSKSRSSTYSHRLQDTVRGATKTIYSNSTSAEETQSQGLTAFTSDGFTIGSDPGNNDNNITYVAWCFDGGTSTVSNTQGSITSSLRASPSSGFSVVTYTTTGSAATIGHGLNVAPSLIITKQRNGTTAWYTYHTSIGAGNYLLLNSTAASAAGSSIWNNTAPTSTVFSVGNGFGNGETYVAYCFSPVVGYSSFGSYTGNGNADGPFVYTGFRPRWVMVKVSSASGYDWLLFDSARDTYNATQLNLRPDLSDAESSQSANPIDFLSNGFKLRGDSSGSVNPNQTLIYAAFAESPFQYSRAR